MVNSARVVSIPPIPEAHFLKCVHQAVALNAEYVPPHHTGAAMYIRPLVFGSCAQLGLEPPEEYAFVVYVLPVGVYHGVRPVDALILEEFDRAAPQGTGSAKVGGNYAPVMRWSSRARSEGFGITLHLDSKTRTVIDEFSTSAFLGLKKDEQGHGYTMVVAESHSAIESVTSDSCQELAKSFGWKVDVRPVRWRQSLSSLSLSVSFPFTVVPPLICIIAPRNVADHDNDIDECVKGTIYRTILLHRGHRRRHRRRPRPHQIHHHALS